MKLLDLVGLDRNPFEQYTAENEPEISHYAVRPPYLRAISSKVKGSASFILFGDRGSGKSATRITVYNDHSGEKIGEAKGPLVVNFTDFEMILAKGAPDKHSDVDIAKVAAFFVIEEIMSHLATLQNDDEVEAVIGKLSDNNKKLVIAVTEIFYLSIPEAQRNRSSEEALNLLKASPTERAKTIAQKDSYSWVKRIGHLASIFSKVRYGSDLNVAADVDELIASVNAGDLKSARMIMQRVVQVVRAFGYSGVCVLVDKVDETTATSDSALATAKLVYPLLGQVQLLEVPGFSWIFFLWSSVQNVFVDTLKVRLDKIANSEVSWKKNELREMIEERIKHFSNGKLTFENLFLPGENVDERFSSLSSLAGDSPRELIKLLDTVLREHDHAGEENLLSDASLLHGMDKYATSFAQQRYARKTLQQVYSIGTDNFVNQDVASRARISTQAAGGRIRKWMNSGLVEQQGQLPSEHQGKHVDRFIVIDPRVARVISRRLDPAVGLDLIGEDDPGED